MAPRKLTPARHGSRLRGAKPGLVYLCTLRRQARLTQKELADRSGLSQPAISRLELYNVQRVSRDTVIQLAEALHVDPLQLRFGPNPNVARHRRSVWRAEDEQQTRDGVADAPAGEGVE